MSVQSVVRVVRGEQFTLTAKVENGDLAVSTETSDSIDETSLPLTFTANGSGWVALTARGPGGSASDTVRVEVIDPPTADVRLSAETVALGDSVQLTLEAANVESGVAVADGNVLLTFGSDQEESGFDASTGLFEATLVAWPKRTTTYVFNVRGDGGTDVKSATVVVPDAPEVRISFEPAGGDSVTIRLEADRADAATLRTDRGPPFERFGASPNEVLRESAVVEIPGSTTTYVATVTGPGGTDSTSTMVTVRTAATAGQGWSFGLGGAGVGVVTGPASFAVPTLSGAAAWGGWHLELRGGLRPMGASGPDPVTPLDPRLQFGPRTQKLVSLSVAYFPTQWREGTWGVAASYVAAWEMVRDLDYYMTRAHGPAVGPRVRERRGNWSLIGGLDLQYAQVSEFDETAARWEFGVTPSVALTYVFD